MAEEERQAERLRRIEHVDGDQLRERYSAEARKRQNPLKTEQWEDISGELAGFADDPYVEPGFQRGAIEEDMDVLIVGGGIGGIVAAAELAQAGIQDFRIVEKAGDFGGTWYWNRYPGVQCDIESYIYLPLLEQTGYIPREKYAYGAEILEHVQRVGRHFDLYDRALFQTRITEMRWDEEARHWRVTTDRGDVLRARHVITASGPLHRLRLPGIPGIASFKGRIFHTSRWDYDYTGGDSTGGLTKLHDKKVALVGTGATGVQVTPFIARDAQHLYVFQRTPSYVTFRGNRPTDPDFARTLKPGWQRERADNFESIIEGGSPEVDLVDDGWTDLNRRLRPEVPLDQLPPDQRAKHAELSDHRTGEALRARIDEVVVSDKAAAEGLKPWYRVFCKRPTFNDGYYPAFNQPNVTLVDTQGQGVERITEDGIVALGQEYKVDCIVFATGFDVTSDLTRRADFQVYGVGGRTLAEHHRNGPLTLHGFYSHGFPNFFIMGLSQNGFSANYTSTVCDQSEHIAWIIAELGRRGIDRFEATAEAEAAWQDVIRDKSTPRRAFLANCTPGDFNGQGDVDRGQLVNLYGGGRMEFSRMMAQWRAAGEMDGLALS